MASPRLPDTVSSRWRCDYNPTGGVLKATSQDYHAVSETLKDAFTRDDLEGVSRLLQDNLDSEPYTLKVLFRDEQLRILNRLMETEWREAEAAFADLYPHLMSMMGVLVRMEGAVMIPRAFNAAAEFVLNARLRHALGNEPLESEGIRKLFADAEGAKVALDVTTLEYTLRTRLEGMAKSFEANPANGELLRGLDAAVGMARSLPLDVGLWKIQNACFELLESTYPKFQQKAEEGGQNAATWIEIFRALAEKIHLRIDVAAKAAAASAAS